VNSYDFRQPERIFFNPYNPSEIWASSFGNGMKVGDISTSITETQDRNLSLEIFPNPATNEITIYGLRFTIEKIEVFNAMGQRIFSQQLTAKSQQQEIKINTAQWSNGIYFVKVKSAENLMTKKLLVAR
jgi:hypothetical protein